MARRPASPTVEISSTVTAPTIATAQTSCAAARAQVAETEAAIAAAKTRQREAEQRRDASVDDAAEYATAERARADAEIEVMRLGTLLERHRATLAAAELADAAAELEQLTASAQEQLTGLRISGEEVGRRVIALRAAKHSLETACKSFSDTRTRIDELARQLGVSAPALPRSPHGLAYAYEQVHLHAQPTPAVLLTKDWLDTPTDDALVQTLREAHGVLSTIPERWLYPVSEQIADLTADPARYMARCGEAATREAEQIERGKVAHETTERAMRSKRLALEIAERTGASESELRDLCTQLGVDYESLTERQEWVG